MQDNNKFKDFYSKRKVLVTGGAGFIGSHLTRSLVNYGAIVSVVDDLSYGTVNNIDDVIDKINFHKTSILDSNALIDICRDRGSDSADGSGGGTEIIFHQAALASVPGSIAEPGKYNNVNVTGTLNVLEAARKTSSVKTVIFASSSSIYGDSPELPKNEDFIPDPLSPYAQQKLTCEHMLRVWAKCYGINTINLRYFNVFGPNQKADSAYAAVVAAFAKALLTNEKPQIFGDGYATRDFTYVDNVIQANLRAGMYGCGITLTTPVSSQNGGRQHIAGEIINVACGQHITINDLAKVMADTLNINTDIIYAPPREGDVLHSLADISKAKKMLGYNPEVTFAQGVEKTLLWYKNTI